MYTHPDLAQKSHRVTAGSNEEAYQIYILKKYQPYLIHCISFQSINFIFQPKLAYEGV